MIERALITSASNKFFPSLINLLGSIKHNYPGHPKIFVYNLGLIRPFRRELELIEGVEVLSIPPFVPFWRSCYTWKPYIFAHPKARLNFYLDAGCQVLRPLDEIFEEIDRNDFFVMNQNVKFGNIVPDEYKSLFEIGSQFDKEDTVHAGEFGFKAESSITPLIANVFQSAVAGLALGFSPADRWRNKGKDKNPYVRYCNMFRHDMTLLNIWFKKQFGKTIPFHDMRKYGGGFQDHPEQIIWNLRLSYRTLSYIDAPLLHGHVPFIARLNRVIVWAMVWLKNLNLDIKRRLGIIK